MVDKSKLGLTTSLTLLTLALAANYAGNATITSNPVILASYPVQVMYAVTISHMIYSIVNSFLGTIQPDSYRYHTYITSAAAMHIAIAFSVISGEVSTLFTATTSVVSVTLIMLGVSLVAGITYETNKGDARAD